MGISITRLVSEVVHTSNKTRIMSSEQLLHAPTEAKPTRNVFKTLALIAVAACIAVGVVMAFNADTHFAVGGRSLQAVHHSSEATLGSTKCVHCKKYGVPADFKTLSTSQSCHVSGDKCVIKALDPMYEGDGEEHEQDTLDCYTENHDETHQYDSFVPCTP